LILSGTRQGVRATSYPHGATVTTSPETTQHSTPASLDLERGKNYILTFSAPGYYPRAVELRRRIRPVVVACDIIMGVVPVVVDAATGAWYRLSPDTARVRLQRADPSGTGPAELDVAIELTELPDRSTASVVSSVPGVTVGVTAR
jgi:hypothetical protein